MTETKVTAHLPHLDVEIIRREYPDEHREVMTLHMQATPSFKAFAQSLAGPPTPALAAAMWMAPLTAWTRLLAMTCLPWLAVATPAAVPGEGRDELPPPAAGDHGR